VCDFKILGSLGLIDDGQMDWKILGMEINEAKAKGVRTIKDYEQLYPGAISEVRKWFLEKAADEGKHHYEYLINGKVIPVADTLDVIQDSQKHY